MGVGGFGRHSGARGNPAPVLCLWDSLPPPPLALQKNEFGVAGVYVADEIDVSVDLQTANIFTGEGAA